MVTMAELTAKLLFPEYTYSCQVLQSFYPESEQSLPNIVSISLLQTSDIKSSFKKHFKNSKQYVDNVQKIHMEKKFLDLSHIFTRILV